MANTITTGIYTITPTLIDGYEAERIGGTIVHPILGRVNPDVTLRPAAMRTGTLRLLFIEEANAKTALDVLSTGAVFRLNSDERDVSMSFVVPEGERISYRLNDEARDGWHLDVPFAEVSAI